MRDIRLVFIAFFLLLAMYFGFSIEAVCLDNSSPNNAANSSKQVVQQSTSASSLAPTDVSKAEPMRMLRGAINGLWYLAGTILALLTFDAIRYYVFRLIAYEKASTAPGSPAVAPSNSTEVSLKQFRFVFIPADPDWMVFFAGLFTASMAVLFVFFTQEEPLRIVGGEWQIVLIPVVAVGLCSVVFTVSAVNLLRFLQYRACIKQNIPPSSHLCYPSSELSTEFVEDQLTKVSESAVHAIKENYTDLTVLISRDDQGSGEMGWSEQFVNKIRQPCITAPPDVFASDSQVSIRSIYPASMRFWAAQIRKSDVTWKILVQDQETEQKTMKYRDGLVAYLQECIKGSRSNFQHLNRNGRCSDCAEERPEALKSNAAISARVLVYAPKVLLTHSVSAVIEFHEAVGIPLFYVPDFYLRALSASDAMWGDHWSKVTQLCDLFAKMQSHWRAKGVSSWNACFEMLPKNPKDLLPLWRGAGDDVVIIDDTAWQGYPGTKDNNPPAGRDPLPVLQKFLFILGLPHVLLASHAREIVSRCQPFESQEMDSLNKWWIRGSNAGIAGVD